MKMEHLGIRVIRITFKFGGHRGGICHGLNFLQVFLFVAVL